MNYQSLIRKRIKEKYKSIENFSKNVGVPRTTINFILKNGIDVSNYKTVTTILDKLDIAHMGDVPIEYDEKLKNLIMKYNCLDDFGKHAVYAVTETEYKRIMNANKNDAIIAAYESISDSSQLTNDEQLILELVRKIKDSDNN